jgi:hypothetical protein
MRASVSDPILERKSYLQIFSILDSWTYSTPKGDCLYCGRIASSEQHLQFVSLETFRRLRGTGRPKPKLPSREPFEAKIETASVVGQNLNGCSTPVAENKECARKWIVFELLLADPGQTVDPFAEIGGRNRHQDAHVSGYRDHCAFFQNVPLRVAKSGTLPVFK